MAAAKVKGFQGAKLARDAGGLRQTLLRLWRGDGGREYARTECRAATLQEVYLPPFAAAVEAGVSAVMPAFTELGGVPLSAHRALLKDYLRGRLGFDGVLISDYNAIAELIHHGVAADIVEAAALALKAGMDIDMMANAYNDGLPMALERGLVTHGRRSTPPCAASLILKEQLGLFDDPYRGAGSRAPPFWRPARSWRAKPRPVRSSC